MGRSLFYTMNIKKSYTHRDDPIVASIRSTEIFSSRREARWRDRSIILRENMSAIKSSELDLHTVRRRDALFAAGGPTKRPR